LHGSIDRGYETVGALFSCFSETNARGISVRWGIRIDGTIRCFLWSHSDMYLKTFASLVSASLLAGGLAAAEAPATSTPNTANTLPPVQVAVAPVTAPAPAPNQIVYTPRLPTAAELTSAASAQGLSVERIEQSANQIVAVYKTSSGQTNTVAYQTLPPAGVATPTTPAPNYTVTAPPPTVVYEQPAPRVVYYDDDPFYYPRIWYPPVSVRLGFGFGHFHGGFHRWR
jgi:hypothetical protein